MAKETIIITYSRRDSQTYPCGASTKVKDVNVTEIGKTYAEVKTEIIKKVTALAGTDYFLPVPEPETIELEVRVESEAT